MRFSKHILQFFTELQVPPNLPEKVDVLWPYQDSEVKRIMGVFYKKFFSDTGQRIFLIGINPGRFGAGVTGICFTDPQRLALDCGITHSLAGGRELSSDFVYRMIRAFGSPSRFYQYFYLTALSPVGFLQEGKNLNYYDVKGLARQLDGWMANAMWKQIQAGANRKIAFSMGKGSNYKHLLDFNTRHGFFERIEALPHPRWVMQYRYTQIEEFIRLYIHKISNEIL